MNEETLDYSTGEIGLLDTARRTIKIKKLVWEECLENKTHNSKIGLFSFEISKNYGGEYVLIVRFNGLFHTAFLGKEKNVIEALKEKAKSYLEDIINECLEVF